MIEMKKIYEFIEDKTTIDFIFPLKKYRNDKSSLGRKVAFGGGAVLLGLGQVIDSIGSVAIAILTSPAELFNVKLSRSFIRRAGVGIVFAAVANTTLQHKNIHEKKV